MMRSAETATFDQRLFRDVMGRFATGVTVVSFMREGAPAGMTVNAFMSVSMSPPLVLVSVRRESNFREHVRAGTRYGVNILTNAQQHIGGQFASAAARNCAGGFSMHNDTPLLRDSLAHVVARVVDIFPAGDHLLYIGEVETLLLGEEAKPLIFFNGRYKPIEVEELSMQCTAFAGELGFESAP